MLLANWPGFWDDWQLYHKVTFDGELKLITINPDVADIDVEVDIYSDWKEWVLTLDYAKYEAALRNVGGDPLPGGDFLGATFFLTNGWRIYLDHSVNFDGNLYTEEGDSPFVVADGTHLSTSTVSNLIDKINTGGGGDCPTAVDIAAAVWGDAAALTENKIWNYDSTISLDPDSYGEVIKSISVGGGATPEQIAQSVWEYSAVNIVADSQGEANRVASFLGKIQVDTANGGAGVVYPLGTEKSPSNNIADAVLIGLENGIRIIHVREDATVFATDNIDGYTIIGSNAGKSEIIITPGASTTFSQFKECALKGTLNGPVVIRECSVEDLFAFQGIMHQTMINAGGIALSTNKNSFAHILSCYSGVPGPSAPEVDMGGDSLPFAMRDYTGGIKLVNKTGIEPVSLDFNSGNLILDGTVTDGDIVVRGVYGLTDNSNVANVIQQTQVDEINDKNDIEISLLDNIDNNVDALDLLLNNVDSKVDLLQIDVTNILTVVDEIIKYHKNRTKINKFNYTMTVYDDNGTTPLHVYDLKDDSGVASITQIFERIPQ